ncbi:MAG: hypothetical protein ABR928_06190 [Terracidiphilus sp.]|jgi:hypothetical protein
MISRISQQPPNPVAIAAFVISITAGGIGTSLTERTASAELLLRSRHFRFTVPRRSA